MIKETKEIVKNSLKKEENENDYKRKDVIKKSERMKKELVHNKESIIDSFFWSKFVSLLYQLQLLKIIFGVNSSPISICSNFRSFYLELIRPLLPFAPTPMFFIWSKSVSTIHFLQCSYFCIGVNSYPSSICSNFSTYVNKNSATNLKKCYDRTSAKKHNKPKEAK